MTAPFAQLGTAIEVPAGGLSLPYELTISDGSGTAALTSADGAHPTVAAGLYSPQGFLTAVGVALRASVFARMVADSFVTTDPGSLAGVLSTIGPQATLSPGIGATLLQWQISGDLGSTVNGPIEVTDVKLLNASSQWCSLGLAWAAETRTESGRGVVGRFQPRWLAVCKASFAYRSRLTYPGDSTRPLADGTAYRWTLGHRPVQRADLRLVDLLAHFLGPPLTIGIFSAFGGAGRHVVDLATGTPAVLANVASPMQKTDVIASPAYVRVGGYSARLRSVSGSTLTLAEPIPSTVTAIPGEVVEWHPEICALIEEWQRVGLLFFGARDDTTGGAVWLSPAYAPDVSDGWTIEPTARGQAYRLYSIDLPLLQVADPDLVA